MSYSYKFPTTLPIDITFFNAESVSPVKLNAIFNYLKAANTSIEMFLGNGIDYNVTENSRKKVIGNISSLIGDVSGNIYMPYNQLPSLFTLYKQYFSTYSNYGILTDNTDQHGIYNPTNDSIAIVDTTNIPINRSFPNDVRIGVGYTVSAAGAREGMEVSVTTVSANASNDNLPTKNTILNSFAMSAAMTTTSRIINKADILITANTFISHLTVSNYRSNAGEFNIHSLYIFEIKSEANGGAVTVDLEDSTIDKIVTPLNSFFAIGKSHKSLYVCKQPCKYSDVTFNSGGLLCNKRSSDGACIGNTYDIFIDDGVEIQNKNGLPICAGTVIDNGHTASTSLVHYITGNSGPTYKYETSYGLTPPEFYVLQSPLLMYYSKQHSLKYHPISMVRNNVGIIEKGEALIYNYKSTAGSPILYNANIQTVSRGVEARPDIVKVFNQPMTVGDNNKYIFISSDIGISQMVNAMLEISSMITGRTVAIYAD